MAGYPPISYEISFLGLCWLTPTAAVASRGYSVIQQNNYPTGKYAVAIVATLIYTAISDRIRSRWECSLAIGVTFVVGSAILVAHPANDAGFFFAFYLLGSTYAPQALWYTWMADLTAQDVQLRAITTGFMNSFDFAFVSCEYQQLFNHSNLLFLHSCDGNILLTNVKGGPSFSTRSPMLRITTRDTFPV